MSKLDPWYDLRARLVDALVADLVGGPDDVVLEEAPLDRFVMGILHPQSVGTMEVEADTPETASGTGPDAVYDPAVALARRQYPSSMGLTVALDPRETPELEIDVVASRYGESEGGRWERASDVQRTFSILTDEPGRTRFEVADSLELQVFVRRPHEGTVPVTVALINTAKEPAKGRKDGLCWFQPRIALRVPQGAFRDRNVARGQGTDDEAGSYALLYRDAHDLAVGHGCAVEWDTGAKRVLEVSTTFVPRYAVALAEPSGSQQQPILMKDLAAKAGVGPLEEMVAGYADWIAEREQDSAELQGELLDAAKKHLREARESAERMRAGIALILRDETACEAFALMNEAMRLQRYRQDVARNGREAADAAVQEWRPFQMAFILMNLPDLTDPESEGRDHVDLLWFPTGGGKTEAYLGLIAYAIFLRRLRDPYAGGVSVIMRYTLRLLTIQQFERAAGLICAMESIRRQRMPDAVPVSLGLWVGQGATPNNAKDARSGLKALERGEFASKGNPRQLLSCPSCGEHLPLSAYSVLSGPDRLGVRCPNGDCDFHGGLPVHLIDDDVYRERPSLVIGTVDKFAMMAWKEQARSIFGSDGASLPPDLIVQDELHLISGPLGTMVGLYETAVDAACSRIARPKVVASTATIRRAEKQVRAVFDRGSRQFPASGLKASDSHFSVEASPEKKGNRLYVGLMSPSVSHTTLMVRVYAAILDAAKALEADESVRDAYWTLLGYFNSLRVLGGAFMQVQDDVPDRLKLIANRLEHDRRELEGTTLELTSRIDSTQVPAALERLGTSFPDPDSPDVVLATNMISVGVDVDRLGLMAVMGQPQATAEYIQATSRVGRKYPGLVLTIYNSARSRDLSHYELFTSYHQALYRQVEATGATPFAARARDRGLHGMLVSLVRQIVPGAGEDKAAGNIASWTEDIAKVKRIVLERARRIAPEEAEALETQLDELIGSWVDAAGAGEITRYPGWRQDFTHALLKDASVVVDDDQFDYPVDEPPWPTMTSLRDVDATSFLYLVPSKRKKANRG
ncbi:helicase [Aeromicrobium senzhongii]|uniref:Helicase n=2 Tax=Aeromicrobium senzhongii TaxID=2663859 RepID=A0ABX6SY07_9ACTN|nr:helicase-related protein [Aeromicrobium senzhongii]MTB89045.1 helicase [Aeromicrobium senzhongii]QNL95983.1 helicase [Aeromicrobium senzhongii]